MHTTTREKIHSLGANLDYGQDWARVDIEQDIERWLEVGETITTAVVTVTAPLVLGTNGIVAGGTQVTYWITATAVGVGTARVKITTSGGRTDERTDYIRVTQR